MQNQPAVDVQVSFAVQALGERALRAKRIHNFGAHAGHDAHVEHNIDAVGQLDADLGKGRANRAHGERHDVHGAALHGSGEVATRLAIRLTWTHPVVAWSGVALEAGADVREVFGACDIVGRRPVKIATRQLLLVELHELTGLEGLGGETLSFLVAAVAPVNGVRLAHGGHRVHPFLNVPVLDHGIVTSDINRSPGSTARWAPAISARVAPTSRVPFPRDTGSG